MLILLLQTLTVECGKEAKEDSVLKKFHGVKLQYRDRSTGNLMPMLPKIGNHPDFPDSEILKVCYKNFCNAQKKRRRKSTTSQEKGLTKCKFCKKYFKDLMNHKKCTKRMRMEPKSETSKEEASTKVNIGELLNSVLERIEETEKRKDAELVFGGSILVAFVYFLA